MQSVPSNPNGDDGSLVGQRQAQMYLIYTFLSILGVYGLYNYVIPYMQSTDNVSKEKERALSILRGKVGTLLDTE